MSFVKISFSIYFDCSRTVCRYWNTRKLLQVKIPYINIFLNLRKPGRTFQLEVLRYAFCLTYICVGTMLSVFLTQVTSQKLWLLNVATDIICIILFLRLCRQVHSSDAWIIFPKEVAFGLSIVLVLNLYVARLIGLYRCDQMFIIVHVVLYNFWKLPK